MARSKWKIPYKHIDLYFIDDNKEIKTLSRSSFIAPSFIGLNFFIYNGIKFFKVSIIKEMVGHKFGEYAPTRKKKINNGTKS